MYGWLWRKLPGGWALKTLESLAMIAIIGAVLVTVVFPWVEPKLPFSGNTVQDGVEQTDAPSPSGTATTAPPAGGTGQPSAPSLTGE